MIYFASLVTHDFAMGFLAMLVSHSNSDALGNDKVANWVLDELGQEGAGGDDAGSVVDEAGALGVGKTKDDLEGVGRLDLFVEVGEVGGDGVGMVEFHLDHQPRFVIAGEEEVDLSPVTVAQVVELEYAGAVVGPSAS